jgi:hypothetical protein
LHQILDIFSKQRPNSGSKRLSFYNSSDDSNNETISESTSKRKLDSIDCSQSDDKSVIPEEFIDSITNEVMIDPILLPSGHSVDKTTLDKYVSEEAKWCRRPSDPFTQLVFTGERQPKPNYILKQRIDEFLSQLCGQSTDERLEPSNKRRIVGYNCVNNRNQLISSKLLASNAWDGRAGSSSSSSSGGAKQVVNNHQKCVECGVAHRSDESIVLYKLLCNHLICRKQLLTKLDPKLATIICKECKCLTRKQSIVKLNHM